MLQDSQGKWVGLDVDVCRAVSAAIFGDSEKVKYVPLSAQQRFTALQSGEVDILSNKTNPDARNRAGSISPPSRTMRPGFPGEQDVDLARLQGGEALLGGERHVFHLFGIARWRPKRPDRRRREADPLALAVLPA